MANKYYEDSQVTLWHGDALDVAREMPSGSADCIVRLTLDDLFGLVDVAMGANTTDEWRYFCGCCWRRARQAQERAAEIASQWEEEARGQ